MKALPPEVRDAAFAAVYLEGCAVDVAMQTALGIFLEQGTAELGLGKDGWLAAIRKRLPRRKQSGVRRIHLAKERRDG